MSDIYLSSPSRSALIDYLTETNPFHIKYQMIVGLLHGRAETPEHVDADGNTIPAQPACGDPSLWYCLVRSDDKEFEVVTDDSGNVTRPNLVLPDGVTVCDVETGSKVVGVFA